MEITELTLLIARFGVLVLTYVLLLTLVFALRADARAVRAPAAPPVAPRRPTTPAPDQTTPQASALAVNGGTLPTTGREYQLFGPLDIGRSVSCNVCIPNHFVSSRHARLYSQEGHWMVEDLGSTNGTVLNGKPLTTAQRIKPGDVLLIGDTEFLIR